MACLFVPDLPVVAEQRARPELVGKPLVVVSEPGARAEVLSASPEARRAGIHPGCALAHARSLCADLYARVASPSQEEAAHQALLDVALSTSPRAERAPSCTGARAGEAAVYLDASGLESLFRSETGLATALVTRAAALDLGATAGVASSRILARLVARRAALRDGPGATGVLPPERERKFLSPLAVDWLEPGDTLAETLTRFGIHRLGDLFALPRPALASRLGPALLERIDRLRGTRGELPLRAPPSTRFEESFDLESPIENLEPFLFVLRGMLSRLLARLALRHLACGELTLQLDLSGGGRQQRQLALAAPSTDLRVLLRRLQLELESAPPDAPIEFVALSTAGTPARHDQLDLFRPAGPAPAALDALLAELESLCGTDRVGAPSHPDDPRPGAFAVAPFEIEEWRAGNGVDSALAARRAGRGTPLLGLRALRPPVAAQVRLRSGRPAWVQSAVARGEVLRCAGPWRATGGWWSPDQHFAFDSYDVATADGLLIRLRHDWLKRHWEIDGVYD